RSGSIEPRRGVCHRIGHPRSARVRIPTSFRSRHAALLRELRRFLLQVRLRAERPRPPVGVVGRHRPFLQPLHQRRGQAAELVELERQRVLAGGRAVGGRVGEGEVCGHGVRSRGSCRGMSKLRARRRGDSYPLYRSGFAPSTVGPTAQIPCQPSSDVTAGVRKSFEARWKGRGAMEYLISVDIDAPPDVVWPVMSDGERWHEWTASVTSVKRLDKGPLRIGSRALIRQPRFPPAVWKVTALEPGRRFVWKSGMPGMWVYGDH